MSPIIYGDGRQTRDFISVRDVVTAIILAGEKQDKPEYSNENVNTFNIGTGRSISILDVALTLIDIFDLKSFARPIHVNPMLGDIMHTYARISRAKNILKFIAKEELKVGLINLIEDYK